MFLVTSRDRPDSYNYEAALHAGNLVWRVVLKVRQPNRDQLDQLLTIAWTTAISGGVVPKQDSK